MHAYTCMCKFGDDSMDVHTCMYICMYIHIHTYIGWETIFLN